MASRAAPTRDDSHARDEWAYRNPEKMIEIVGVYQVKDKSAESRGDNETQLRHRVSRHDGASEEIARAAERECAKQEKMADGLLAVAAQWQHVAKYRNERSRNEPGNAGHPMSIIIHHAQAEDRRIMRVLPKGFPFCQICPAVKEPAPLIVGKTVKDVGRQQRHRRGGGNQNHAQVLCTGPPTDQPPARRTREQRARPERCPKAPDRDVHHHAGAKCQRPDDDGDRRRHKQQLPRIRSREDPPRKRHAAQRAHQKKDERRASHITALLALLRGSS